jgi:anti-sigma B factor antagonist
LEVETVGDVTIVRITARRILEEEMASAIGRDLCDLANTPGCRKVLVHFGQVESMTTMMMGQLLALHRRLQAVGGRLVLCNTGPVLGEMFQLIRLPEVVRLYPEEQEALQSF